jgi:hypothetical protein
MNSLAQIEHLTGKRVIISTMTALHSRRVLPKKKRLRNKVKKESSRWMRRWGERRPVIPDGEICCTPTMMVMNLVTFGEMTKVLAVCQGSAFLFDAKNVNNFGPLFG